MYKDNIWGRGGAGSFWTNKTEGVCVFFTVFTYQLQKWKTKHIKIVEKSNEETESSSQIDLSKEKPNKMYSYLHQLGIYRVLSIEIAWLTVVQYLSFDSSSLKGEPRRFLAILPVPI